MRPGNSDVPKVRDGSEADIVVADWDAITAGIYHRRNRVRSPQLPAERRKTPRWVKKLKR